VIPVLGVPILTMPHMLDEMLASVDVKVGRLVIIDNGGVVGDINAEVVRPDQNLGVAASWNLIMREFSDAPWWAIVGFDVIFAPGDLDRLVKHMETVGGCALLGGFSAFGIDHLALDGVGEFDENFHPAYFEDNDYDYRCQMAGVSLVGLPAGLQHRNSATISSEHYSRENGRTFPQNALYYRMKWGGYPRHERFTTPFNAGGSVRDWTLDLARIEDQRWNPE